MSVSPRPAPQSQFKFAYCEQTSVIIGWKCFQGNRGKSISKFIVPGNWCFESDLQARGSHLREQMLKEQTAFAHQVSCPGPLTLALLL